MLRREQVLARIGLSRSSLYNLMVTGDFPKPVALGTRAVGWIESEVQDWLQQKIAVSRGDVS
jgi:prophage regulatory protein